MILEFTDNTIIEVNDIYGGPELVNGIMRDVLTIEIDSNQISLEDLQTLFSNESKLAHLYTYELNEQDEEERVEIGEGYTILMEASMITRDVIHFPGKIYPPETEDVYIVKLAQMTYDEWINSEYYTPASLE